MHALQCPKTLDSASVLLDSPKPGMDDDEFYEFCQAHPNLRIERTALGEIEVMAPAGGESSYRSGEAYGQLRSWARRTGTGKSFDSSAEFILPDRSALAPDAAWVSNASLSKLSLRDRKKFLKLVPDFVVEVMSPSDRLPAVKNKMELWRRNGVELGWLIDGDAKCVYVYRRGQNKFEKVSGAAGISGEGPVAGFELDLTDIWAGLDF